MNYDIDQMHFLVLHIGEACCRASWNYKNICSPFTRIYYVTKGHAGIVMPTFTQSLRPGFMYIVPAFTPHSYVCHEEFCHYYIHIYNESDHDILEDWALPTEIKADATAHSTDGTTLSGADSYTDWEDVIDNVYASAGSAVDATTRSVALVDPIQYAVAQLELKARFNNGGGTGTVNDRDGAPVPVPTAGFPFTGLLIGDQKQVDWKFNTTTAADATSYTIYDNDLYQGGSTTANSAVVKGYEEFASIQPVYTLALETAGEQSGNAETVRFALELKNTSGTAFAGVDGIVPAGGTFYLIGQLSTDPTDASAERATKVFWQDHKTTARVSISSLASAYNCIPDLREPQLELALSVDLEWQRGLVDDVEIQ